MGCSFLYHYPGPDILRQRELDIITRRAYDLVQHTCSSIGEAQRLEGRRLHPQEMLDRVPDLPGWPAEAAREGEGAL